MNTPMTDSTELFPPFAEELLRAAAPFVRLKRGHCCA